ncbi:3-deoxy-D-manno-octulosonate 8-phosphate phosphatase [Francisella halioticida]|uniref:3-deoxy-D-manno-octulosonate 8-phosphate phosphatase KdsC n=1 Tax=Francisella halioticida TaxID=549298 RepID=A0ABN5B2W3_9GAMM|nr:HAD-IIIA family hydrolase [Francisella halioticida]ASG68018.1 3-deoxy-D-manno-octulosonate 8-phosphate phosphatase [Francisella halioticida]BCD90422.1 3-deoxy-D-manno-octulosonate 8-phosphate phosphatase [Francisella halioticida]
MKINKSKNIKLLILDIDGVLTDGKIIISNSGNEYKNFNVKDGLGLVLLQKLGLKIAVITGKSSRIVADRLASLGLDSEDIFQGQKNKLRAYEVLKERYNLENKNIAYIGDDLPDIALMNKVAVSAAPADSIGIVKDYADYVCHHNGGDGATREFCEYLIKHLGLHDKVVRDFVEFGEVK